MERENKGEAVMQIILQPEPSRRNELFLKLNTETSRLDLGFSPIF